jgi:hypothetical protein
LEFRFSSLAGPFAEGDFSTAELAGLFHLRSFPGTGARARAQQPPNTITQNRGRGYPDFFRPGDRILDSGRWPFRFPPEYAFTFPRIPSEEWFVWIPGSFAADVRNGKPQLKKSIAAPPPQSDLQTRYRASRTWDIGSLPLSSARVLAVNAYRAGGRADES